METERFGWRFYTLVRKQIPIFSIFVYVVVIRESNLDCTDTTAHRAVFWSVYPLLCLFTLLFEGYNHATHFRNSYRYGKTKSMIIYSVLSGLLSLLCFIAVTYYCQTPFDCLFEHYSHAVAQALLYTTLAIVLLVAYWEHRVWPRLVPAINLDYALPFNG